VSCLTGAVICNIRCTVRPTNGRDRGCLPCPIELVTQLLLLDEKTSDVDAGVEDLDAIPVNPELDVWSLVEDEVLLAQPIAPRHMEGQCEAASKLKDDAASPFAALAGLKDKQLN
jgi:uncharacterized protein